MGIVLSLTPGVSWTVVGRSVSAPLVFKSSAPEKVQMPRSRNVTGVAVVGVLAWFGAAGFAAEVGTPTAESPEPTASRVLPTLTLAQPTPADPAEVLRATVVPRLLASLPSPDGKLRAEIVTYACTPVEGEQAYALDQLVIRGSNPDSSWVADEQLQACGGLGAYGLGGLYRSSDSQRFYSTPAREGVPDGCGMWFPPIAFADVQRRFVRELGAGVLSRTAASWLSIRRPGSCCGT